MLIVHIFRIRLVAGKPKSNVIEGVDLTDTRLFAKLADEWWDPLGCSAALLAYNRIRVPFVVEGLIAVGTIPADRLNKPNALEGIKVLDVGCGAGLMTESLGKLGAAEVIGLEPCEELVGAARKHLKKSKLTNVKYICETIEKHIEKHSEQYDVIIMSEVIEHVVNESKKPFIRSCVKALKPGGLIFITTLNKTIESLFGAKIVGEYFLNAIIPNSHEWHQFISPEDVRNILKDFSCTTQEIRGMQYQWWKNYSIWTWYKGISFALYAVKDEVVDTDAETRKSHKK